MIDPHVHLRDFNQKNKETIKGGLILAKSLGFTHVFDMPNTDPPLTSREVLLRRLTLAKEANISGVSYHTYIGITNSEEQIKDAVNLFNEFFPSVVGLKMFLGHSTGNMGITEKNEQEKIVRLLSKLDYEGVLVVHAEKEEFINNSLYNPLYPETHLVARPNIAEIESIKDIIEIVKKVDFKGKLHIAHVSCKESLKLIKEAKKDGVKISMGITPHHALFNISDNAKDKDLKVNPPLREEEDRKAIYGALLDDDIDYLWVESDYAPHTKEDKDNGAAGLRAIEFTPILIKKLREDNISEDRLISLMGLNVINTFILENEKILVPFN